MNTWLEGNRPVFPLFSGEPASKISGSGLYFPRHISEDSLIVRCETGWIRVAPGTDKSSPAFGYIQVSDDGSQMAVYHLWGDA
jgi:hypothetical protein